MPGNFNEFRESLNRSSTHVYFPSKPQNPNEFSKPVVVRNLALSPRRVEHIRLSDQPSDELQAAYDALPQQQQAWALFTLNESFVEDLYKTRRIDEHEFSAVHGVLERVRVDVTNTNSVAQSAQRINDALKNNDSLSAAQVYSQLYREYFGALQRDRNVSGVIGLYANTIQPIFNPTSLLPNVINRMGEMYQDRDEFDAMVQSAWGRLCARLALADIHSAQLT